MSEKQKEKVTPEEYIKANTINDFYPDSEWVDPKHAIKAVELARKEGEERIREILLEIGEDITMPLDSWHRVLAIFTKYLPEKGDNNDKA